MTLGIGKAENLRMTYIFNTVLYIFFYFSQTANIKYFYFPVLFIKEVSIINLHAVFDDHHLSDIIQLLTLEKVAIWLYQPE